MLKKAFGVGLCVMLIFCLAFSSLAATDYTLPEKMSKQLSIGSGLKGQFTITAEGNDPIVLALYPFLNTELQMRGLTSEGESHYYFYQDIGDETQRGLTEFYIKDNQLYCRSDMLGDKVLCLPELGALVNTLTKSSGENPAFASILLNIFQQGENGRVSVWEPLTDKLTKKLELWISRFEVSSSRDSEEGAVVEINYTIPMGELKKEVLTLLRDIRQDPEIRAALEAVMTEEQRNIYLNDGLDYFYTDAMNALEDNFDVVISRTISTMGKEISSSIELPLDGTRFGGYTSLKIEAADKTTSVILKNNEQVLHVVTDDGLFPAETDYLTWWIMSYPNRETESASTARSALRVRYSRTSETSTDVDGRDHQNDRYTIRGESDTSRLPAEENGEVYPEAAPFVLDILLHYSSKNSQSSPTTLAISATLEMNQMKLHLDGTFKTASPWIFSPFDIAGARNLLELSDDEKNLMLAEWLAAAGEQLSKAQENAGAEKEAAETEQPAAPAESPEAENEASPEDPSAAEENPTESGDEGGAEEPREEAPEESTEEPREDSTEEKTE